MPINSGSFSPTPYFLFSPSPTPKQRKMSQYGDNKRLPALSGIEPLYYDDDIDLALSPLSKRLDQSENLMAQNTPQKQTPVQLKVPTKLESIIK